MGGGIVSGTRPPAKSLDAPHVEGILTSRPTGSQVSAADGLCVSSVEAGRVLTVARCLVIFIARCGKTSTTAALKTRTLKHYLPISCLEHF